MLHAFLKRTSNVKKKKKFETKCSRMSTQTVTGLRIVKRVFDQTNWIANKKFCFCLYSECWIES